MYDYYTWTKVDLTNPAQKQTFEDYWLGLADGTVVDGLPARMDRWPSRPGEAQHEWEAPRTATGIPQRAPRLKALGNAVVPQVAYVVGRVVMEIARRQDA